MIEVQQWQRVGELRLMLPDVLLPFSAAFAEVLPVRDEHLQSLAPGLQGFAHVLQAEHCLSRLESAVVLVILHVEALVDGD